jgi:hypothetical protein
MCASRRISTEIGATLIGLDLVSRHRVCGTSTGHESNYMDCFAHSNGWAVSIGRSSVTRVCVFIDRERNNVINHGCDDVLTFDRPNAR